MDELEFELRVDALADGSYQAVVIKSPAGEGTSTFRMPFEGAELTVRLQALELALPRSGGPRRALPSPQEQTVRTFGHDLFDTLFAGDVRTCFDRSLAEADQREEPLRIKLRFVSPALAVLPWEFLFDSRQSDFLVLSANTPLVRYVEAPQAQRPLMVKGPLRMLGMVASPSDQDPIDVGKEKERINVATAELVEKGLLELRWLERGTFAELQEAMWAPAEWHIFHFAGHGIFNPNSDEGLVAFVNEEGKADIITAEVLGRQLGDHRPLRLAFLNSCEGARGSSHDLLSSTAATLVMKKTPAVVAMQYEITDEAAMSFGRAFYRALAASLPVDIAMAEARKTVAKEIANSLEWGTPVLYMRSPDTVLFKVRPVRAASPPPLDIVVAPKPGPATGERAAPSASPPTVGPPADPVTVPPTPVPTPLPGPGGIWERLQGRAGLALIVVLAIVAGAFGIRYLTGGGGNDGVGGSSATPPTAGLAVGPSPALTAPASVPIAKGTLVVGFDLVRANHAQSQGILEAVDLAIADVDGQVNGWEIERRPTTTAYDDGDPDVGADNVRKIVRQRSVVAVIGPYSSGVAASQIPLSNAAGLLQCSPSATSASLTEAGSRNNSARINFVRTVTTTNFDGIGAARFAIERLGKTRAFVLDNDEASAHERASRFVKYFSDRGGTVVDRQSVPIDTADLTAIAVVARNEAPDVFYFSSSSTTGSSNLVARFLKATHEVGLGEAFIASGEVFSDQKPFLTGAAGHLGPNVYAVYPAVGDYPGRVDFEARYQRTYGHAPTLYLGSAYACAEVVLDAIRRAADATGPDGMREAVRAEAVDPSVAYRTLIGDFHFDANGDTSQQILTIYRADASVNGWVLSQTLDVAR